MQKLRLVWGKPWSWFPKDAAKPGATCVFLWQVTLTTHLDGSQGYIVYIDGNLAAELPSQSATAVNASLAANPNLQLDGGRPIDLQVIPDSGSSLSGAILAREAEEKVHGRCMTFLRITIAREINLGTHLHALACWALGVSG